MLDGPWRDDDLLTGPQIAKRLGIDYRLWHRAVTRGLVPRAAVPFDPSRPANRQARQWRWGDVKDWRLRGQGTRTDLLPRQCPDCAFTGSATEFAAHRATAHGGIDDGAPVD